MNDSQPIGSDQTPAPEAPPATRPTEPEAQLAELREQLARLQAERDELWQTLVRRQADFENYRKRIERERQEDADRTLMAFAEQLLPILDNFERALALPVHDAVADHWRGFELIYRQLEDVLARHGITRIENPLGKPFDPYYHHALERVETLDQPEGTVLEVVQTGYRFRDRLLRPALVRVAARPAAESAN